MFRTRVLYLWLQMVGLATALLAAGSLVSAGLFPDFKLGVLLVLLFPLTLVALATLIVLGLPMLVLLQRLLLAVGARAGRPTTLPVFRRWLRLYSLLPAALPLLALLLPAVRRQPGPAAVVLAAWALATTLVWRRNARRLYLEWEAGVPY
ncbi:hypothetical protein [Hymenobacter cheonanensis]|uniref:hypothetical protein n=1 Tax=Hymenobacter sp. CA2-7 TaxID=3063993 RepID=UPI0027126CBC|nr:hypothetical protein [Hymenobacter sp. CA2-7]MDO7884205.1 hypothetical protein [Hymenobacter sp. CA2-7]